MQQVGQMTELKQTKEWERYPNGKGTQPDFGVSETTVTGYAIEWGTLYL